MLRYLVGSVSPSVLINRTREFRSNPSAALAPSRSSFFIKAASKPVVTAPDSPETARGSFFKGLPSIRMPFADTQSGQDKNTSL